MLNEAEDLPLATTLLQKSEVPVCLSMISSFNLSSLKQLYCKNKTTVKAIILSNVCCQYWPLSTVPFWCLPPKIMFNTQHALVLLSMQLLHNVL